MREPRNWRRGVGPALLTALAVLLVAVPKLPVATAILPGALDSPGSLDTLAICFCIAALAVSYDVLMGYLGLFSFGHALFFGVGGYAFAMMETMTGAGFVLSVLVALGTTVIISAVVNVVGLRSTAIAFSMVTLAFVELASILNAGDYLHTGGEDGIPLAAAHLPSFFVGVFNARNVYWLALGLLVVVIAAALWLTSTRMGHIWIAIRENELRVSVMGVDVYRYKLAAATISGSLAGLAGIVYTIVIGTADPSVLELFYSIGLVLMVVLGGRGTVWGAAVGGVIYSLAQQRLPVLAGSSAIAHAPSALRVPLQSPQVLLGVVFIIFIFAAPGGLAELVRRVAKHWHVSPTPPAAPGAASRTQPRGTDLDVIHE